MSDEEMKAGLAAYKAQKLRENDRDTQRFQMSEENQKGGKIGALKEIVGKHADLFLGNRRIRGRIISVDGKTLTVRVKIWGMHNIFWTLDIRKIAMIAPLEYSDPNQKGKIDLDMGKADFDMGKEP